MIELSQLTVMIAGEVLVGLLVLSGILVLFAVLRKGRIRKAVQHLAGRVQNDKPQRTERLKKLLANKYGYEGNDLEQAVHNITQTEMQLYQNLINGLMKDDQMHLQQVDVDVENLVLAYQTLNTPAAAAADAAQEQSDGEQDEEIQHLRDENQRLSEELRVTMDTMGRMLNEYSTMFAGGASDSFAKAGQETPPATPAPAVEDEVVETEESPVDESADVVIEADMTDALAENTDSEPAADDTAGLGGGIDIEIPDLQASEVDTVTTGSIVSEGEEVSPEAVDEEVSEIIDEVMGIADEMATEDETSLESTTGAVEEEAVESLMDEVEQVDIEIPDVEGETISAEESEAASLEEEWAKLLEEDATAHKEEKKDQ